MRSLVLAVVANCCCFIIAAAQKYHPDYQDGAIWLKLKPTEEVLVNNKEKPGVDDIRILKPIKDKYKLKDLEKPFQKINKVSPLQNTYLLTFEKINEADKLIKELEKSGVLEYAEKVPLNIIVATPNDPSIGTQWHLAKINAQGAWDLHSSAGNTIIAIVDDAVQTNHPDLAANIWVNSSELNGVTGIDDDKNGFVDDIKGWDFADNDNDPDPATGLDHGTHVAGIASAVSNNGVGVSSIGFCAQLMCVKTSNIATEITNGYEGIIYAADNGAHVINLSWGSYVQSLTGRNVINYALSKGCIIVAAAGNDNMEDQFFPAAYDGVISVAATDNVEKKAWFSNYGSWVTVSAPGVSIYSTTVGGYGYKQGTSMASPLVAGLVALMRSYNPAIPNADLINLLQSTADNIDATNTSYVGKLGTGRINAAKAMQAISTTLSLPPTADFSVEHTTVSAGATVSFRDLSSYATTWSWSFPGGTPASSTEKNPVITYNSLGTYNVSLTVTNANGSDIETRTGYITVNTGSSCIRENYPVPVTWSEIEYTTPDEWWVNGVNEYGDVQKAMFFDASATATTHLTKVKIKFGGAYSDDLGKIVKINIYDGTTGNPFKLLRSENLSMGKIMDDMANAQNEGYSEINFNDPVILPASKKYFVSVDFSNLYGSTVIDPLFIWSNASGETTQTNVWEQWNTVDGDTSWHQYDEPGNWGLNISLLIHPYLTNQPAIAKITPSATTICAGSMLSFDAAGSTYQTSLNWAFPGTAQTSIDGNPTPSVSFNTPGTHQVKLTVQGGGCDEIHSQTVPIIVNENVTPTVNLAMTHTPGGPVKFTTTATHAGTSPGFAFMKNNNVVQSGPSNTWTTTALNEGDMITCTLTSNENCVTSSMAVSNSISMDAFTLIALPVELLYFKGNNINGESVLQWATATEYNTEWFIIERSGDGKLFQQIGTIKAKGESNTTTTYHFSKTAPAPAFYRLRMVDLDGSFKYSEVIYLKDEQKAGVRLWPNPATTGQNIRLTSQSDISNQAIVQLIDAFGKVMSKKHVTAKNGYLETDMPTQSLKAGVYFITVTDETNGYIKQEKLVITN